MPLVVYAGPSPQASFSALDDVLLNKEQYMKLKLQQIKRQKQVLKTMKAVSFAAYNQNIKIFDAYKTLNFDSALYYAVSAKSIADQLKDPFKSNHAKINIAFVLLSSGMFNEANDQFGAIDTANLTRDDKVDLLTLRVRYYYDLCDFVKSRGYCNQYMAAANKYADAAIALAVPHSYRYYYILGLKHLKNGNYNQAIVNYNRILRLQYIDQHQYAIIVSSLSYLYERKGEQVQHINYLIDAAIADVKYCTKENVALFKLADHLFKMGDNERAYRYIKHAMVDAEYYGARHRQFEVGTLLPIIEGKQMVTIQKQKNIIVIYAGSLTFLILLILVFIIVVIRQNKKLKLAQLIISRANDELHLSNNRLNQMITALELANKAIKEADRIKDEYIGYYFNVISDYVDKIERFKKTISQRLALGRYEAIKQVISNIDLKKEREDLAISFDRVFLKLFPNFIEKFNGLFDENECFGRAGDKTLNTELRIFALIRLGIHDNDKIAKILNFSVNTIYVYKTRVRNKSLIPNDQFDSMVMAIEAD